MVVVVLLVVGGQYRIKRKKEREKIKKEEEKEKKRKEKKRKEKKRKKKKKKKKKRKNIYQKVQTSTNFKKFVNNSLYFLNEFI